MKRQRVSPDRCHEKRDREALAQEIKRNQGRDDGAGQKCDGQIVSVLEHDVLVTGQIAHVDLCAVLFHVWVLFAQKPANMREEEAAS